MTLTPIILVFSSAIYFYTANCKFIRGRWFSFFYSFYQSRGGFCSFISRPRSKSWLPIYYKKKLVINVTLDLYTVYNVLKNLLQYKLNDNEIFMLSSFANCLQNVGCYPKIHPSVVSLHKGAFEVRVFCVCCQAPKSTTYENLKTRIFL